MKPHLRPARNFLFTIICLAFTHSVFAQYFVAPVGYLPDPSIYFHDGWYYSTGTMGGSVRINRAKTLEGLKSSVHTWVFGPSASGAPCCDYWAPELHRIDNKWYIYYTAKVSGGSQNMWVIENSSDNPLEGTWINRGRIYDPANDYWAIDATVFQLNGSMYYIYSGVAQASDGDKPQRLYIARMSNPWTLSTNRVHISSPTYDWERDGHVNEGPAVLQANGKTFLVYSASGCWTTNYKLGMMWIDDWEDPMNPGSWEKLSQPVFTKDPGVDAYGPGHNTFFTSPDGKETWMAYHATPDSSGTCDMSRSTHAKKITFDSNGFPVFGTPIKTGKRLTPPSGEVAVAFKGDVINGIYKIQASSATRPLDVAGCSPQRGANVQQWESFNNDCQKWHIQATEDGHYWIGSVRGGLTMEVEGCSADNAANVRMWTPNGNTCQKWDIIPNGDGTYRIASVKSGKVLDIQFGGDDNGANLQIYSYLGNAQQHFNLTLLDAGPKPSNGWYQLTSKRSNKNLNIENCDLTNGANVVQNSNDVSNPCQKWHLEDGGDGFYSLVNNASGRALNVSGCSTAPGANINTYDVNQSDCQKFSLVHVKDDWYSLIARSSGLALDVGGCSTNEGQNIGLWTNWLGDCQLWKFKQVEPGGLVGGTGWTTWYSHDSPNGTGDYENPGTHSSSCSSPLAIEARITGTDEIIVPGYNEPEVFDTFNAVDGLACRNASQTDGMCNNYDVRFYCNNNGQASNVSWSDWRNRDTQGGSGDFETRADFTNPAICENPFAIEARTVGTQSVFAPGVAEPEIFADFSPSVGLLCRNADQSDGSCNNYSVRFLCGTNGSSSSSSSSSSNSSSSGGTTWTTKIEAENYALASGIETEPCTEGGENVGWIDVGDWIVWDVNIPTSGNFKVEYRVAGLYAGIIQLEQAGGSPVFGQINVPVTGGWQQWQTISHTVSLQVGQQEIAIYVPQSGFNLNWIQFTRL